MLQESWWGTPSLAVGLEKAFLRWKQGNQVLKHLKTPGQGRDGTGTFLGREKTFWRIMRMNSKTPSVRGKNLCVVAWMKELSRGKGGDGARAAGRCQRWPANELHPKRWRASLQDLELGREGTIFLYKKSPWMLCGPWSLGAMSGSCYKNLNTEGMGTGTVETEKALGLGPQA